MNVEITNQPELRTAGVRHIGPYMHISEAFAKLGSLAGPAGLFGPDALLIGIYHDDVETTPEQELRSDAALVVSRTAKIPSGLTEIVIPAGRYARTTHLGPYDRLGDTWSRLKGEWLSRSGHRVGDGMSYEVYRNNPHTAKPEELITDIYIPLR